MPHADGSWRTLLVLMPAVAVPAWAMLPLPEIAPENALLTVWAKTSAELSIMLPVKPEVSPVNCSVPSVMVVVPE